VHDVAVLSKARGKGVGRKLLERVIEIARERDYCKVNLEVREDNAAAKHLYNDLGFVEDNPPMHFWTKIL
jgi:ribosomal protein S18 acetylase RimI-like enzyme